MKVVLLIGLTMMSWLLHGQQFSEKIKGEYTFEIKSDANAILVANINGSITVTGYEGDKILLEVTKTINAKSEQRLEEGKGIVQLGVIDRADTLIFYVKDGCNKFVDGQYKSNKRIDCNDWGYVSIHDDCSDNNRYDYQMDFVVKVPNTANVVVSTINEGSINIEKVSGSVKANNINGSIRLTGAAREAQVSTINGDVDIEYIKNPLKDCRFYSLNGDINAHFEKGLAANITFESFNGDFYTNINAIESLPVTVEKSAKGEGIKYKVNGNRYQVGRGGALLDFETFNGNVYLKEK